MEDIPVVVCSEDFHLTGLRGKLHRLLERFREFRSRLGRGNRRLEKQRRKEVKKLHGALDDALRVTAKTSEDRNTVTSHDDDDDDDDDEVTRRRCFGNLFRKRRKMKEYALRTGVHTVSPVSASEQVAPVVNSGSVCRCFSKKSKKLVTEANLDIDKLVVRLRAEDCADVRSCSKKAEDGRIREAADEALSGGGKAPLEDSSGEEINKTAADKITFDTFDAQLVERITSDEGRADGREIMGVSAAEALGVAVMYEPTPGPSIREDPVEMWARQSRFRPAEKVAVIVTERQTNTIRTLPSPNKYKIRIIETCDNSETSSETSSCSESESSAEPASSSSGASSDASTNTLCSWQDIFTNEEEGAAEVVTDKTGADEPRKTTSIVLHHATKRISLTSSGTLSADSRSLSKWRPSPPIISGLGFCHRWAVQNILEDIDSKFPIEFPRTSWAPLIIKRQQVSYKMHLGAYQIAGEGVYGSVFRCDVRISGKTSEAVIKFLRKLNTRGANALREAKLMEMLRDKCGDFVPELLGVVYVKPDQTYIRWGLVCEDVNDNSFGFYGNTLQGVCDLHMELLLRMKEGTSTWRLPIPRRDWLYIIRDIAIGLAYIHRAGVILNDLKATNLLLQRRGTPVRGCNWRVAFIDFGLASFGPRGKPFGKKDLDYWRAKCWHVAPEVFKGRLSTFKSDIYAFGILVKPIVQMFHFVRHHSLRMMCIREDPVVRPTAGVLANELDILARTEPGGGEVSQPKQW